MGEHTQTTPDLAALQTALEKKRYQVRRFARKEEAAAYLLEACRGSTIGFGDSQTMVAMGLFEALSRENTVYDPAQGADNDQFLELARQALTADCFLTSANAITQDGVIVNLDGTGNRVAGSLFGHRKMYYLISRNKVVPDLDQAIWRVRNVAAPRNARRLKLRTPCALREEARCFDCRSPDRICNGLLIQLQKMNDMEEEILLIDEDLGY